MENFSWLYFLFAVTFYLRLYWRSTSVGSLDCRTCMCRVAEGPGMRLSSNLTIVSELDILHGRSWRLLGTLSLESIISADHLRLSRMMLNTSDIPVGRLDGKSQDEKDSLASSSVNECMLARSARSVFSNLNRY